MAVKHNQIAFRDVAPASYTINATEQDMSNDQANLNGKNLIHVYLNWVVSQQLKPRKENRLQKTSTIRLNHEFILLSSCFSSGLR